MRGETWKATELVKMVRTYQPDVIMDNRLEVSGEGFGSLLTKNPTDYCGDFVSPEMLIPPCGIRNENREPVPWEACITMNNHWGYCEDDKFFKPADILIKKLVECVSKGGNLIVNVGPDANGRIPEESIRILDDVGNWMSRNHDSVYGCRQSSLPKPEYGRITEKDGKLYYHVMESQLGYLPLYGIRREDIRRIRVLKSGAELKPLQDNFTVNYPEIVFVSPGSNPVLPDPIDTVIEVERK
jgi:alpha-L-fucosidase